MKENEIKVEAGQKITVVNKYGDEIADGIVTEIDRDGFTMDTGDAVLFQHIIKQDETTIALSVAS